MIDYTVNIPPRPWWKVRPLGNYEPDALYSVAVALARYEGLVPKLWPWGRLARDVPPLHVPRRGCGPPAHRGGRVDAVPDTARKLPLQSGCTFPKQSIPAGAHGTPQYLLRRRRSGHEPPPSDGVPTTRLARLATLGRRPDLRGAGH